MANDKDLSVIRWVGHEVHLVGEGIVRAGDLLVNHPKAKQHVQSGNAVIHKEKKAPVRIKLNLTVVDKATPVLKKVKDALPKGQESEVDVDSEVRGTITPKGSEKQ